ncbi:MAG: hypothetical protein ABSH20_04980 [Tepidisphaeraceae bacterium]|jgi:hypothetical protein
MSKDKKRAVIRLYGEPRPEITLIVPRGYRGPLRVELQTEAGWVQDAVGKREFAFHVSKTGFVCVRANWLIQTLFHRPLDEPFKVVDESGQTIPSSFPRNSPVSVHWIHSDGRRFLYAIGDDAECARLEKAITREISVNPHVIATDVEAFEAFFRESPATRATTP